MVRDKEGGKMIVTITTKEMPLTATQERCMSRMFHSTPQMEESEHGIYRYKLKVSSKMNWKRDRLIQFICEEIGPIGIPITSATI